MGAVNDEDDAVFKALASPTRRRMLDALRPASLTTGALVERVPDLDRTTVLQHLRVLERAGLVIGRKVGRERHLTLSPMPIKRIHDRWIGEYARAAVALLDDLGADAAPQAPSGLRVSDVRDLTNVGKPQSQAKAASTASAKAASEG